MQLISVYWISFINDSTPAEYNTLNGEYPSTVMATLNPSYRYLAWGMALKLALTTLHWTDTHFFNGDSLCGKNLTQHVGL